MQSCPTKFSGHPRNHVFCGTKLHPIFLLPLAVWSFFLDKAVDVFWGASEIKRRLEPGV
jgi:hypothetical protein